MRRFTSLLLALLQTSCAGGEVSVRDMDAERQKEDLIRIESPRPGDTVRSPLRVTGRARGPWFFEATFPMVLEDEHGRELGTSYATARDAWMTEDFVEFEGTIEAELGEALRGTLILKKSNPSGLPEHDDALRVPVEFGQDNAQTDNATVRTEEVQYGAATGYLALPEDDGHFPALILIHEWWGLNDNIRSFAEEFAKQGYVALAVDLYEGKSTQDPNVARVLAGAVREDLDGAFANLSSAVEYLKSRPEVAPDKLASVGWCFGGGWSYQMARSNMGLSASVIYYGPFNLEDDLQHMRSTIIGHFGANDQSIPVDSVKAFRAKLATVSGEHQIFIYENQGHGFA